MPTQSLWDWAIKHYQNPAVADVCIELQDSHGSSVCELLWCAWLASDDRAPNAQALSDYRRLRRGLYLAVERLRGARRLLELDPVTRELGRKTRPLEIETEALLLKELEGLDSEALAGRHPFHTLHRIDAPFPNLPPNEEIDRFYTTLLERMAAVAV